MISIHHHHYLPPWSYYLVAGIYTCMGVPSGPFFIHIPAACLCLCLCCKAVHDIAPCFCSALLLHLIAYGTLHIYINTWKLNVYRITPHFTRAMVGQLSVTNSSVTGQKGNIVFRCAKNRALWVIIFLTFGYILSTDMLLGFPLRKYKLGDNVFGVLVCHP